jgi:SPP1 gp7 family putative phage head morphogenesis protein
LRAEQTFASSLKSVALQIGALISAHPQMAEDAAPELTAMLRAYSVLIRPWATRVVSRMLQDVNAQDINVWRSRSEEIGTALRREILHTPTGIIMEKLLHEQTEYITSMPLKAALRVQRLASEAMFNSERSTTLIKEVMRTGEVSYGQAKMIARTTVAEVASNLTEARATAAGATHYIWRTADDSDVRPGHKVMEGKVCEWANPPAVNEGGKVIYHHPGRIWNCRCWAETIINAME